MSLNLNEAMGLQLGFSVRGRSLSAPLEGKPSSSAFQDASPGFFEGHQALSPGCAGPTFTSQRVRLLQKGSERVFELAKAVEEKQPELDVFPKKVRKESDEDISERVGDSIFKSWRANADKKQLTSEIAVFFLEASVEKQQEFFNYVDHLKRPPIKKNFIFFVIDSLPAGITHLNLGNQRFMRELGGVIIEKILNNGNLSELKHLDLCSCPQVTMKMVALIVNNVNLRKLEFINLDNCAGLTIPGHPKMVDLGLRKMISMAAAIHGLDQLKIRLPDDTEFNPREPDSDDE